MLHGPRLAAVRPEHEGVEVALGAEVVERRDVGVHVVDVVRVRRVLALRPRVRRRHVRVEHRVLGLGLVVDRVEADDVLQEAVELGVEGGGDGHLEQGPEQVVCSAEVIL